MIISMTETTQTKSPLDWSGITPVFKARLTPPKRPERPSDMAISLAQASYDGQDVEGERFHVMSHRFKTEAQAAAAADELKRAGAYTTPESTVTVAIDPEKSGDKRVLSWRASGKRGRKTS